MKVSLFLSMVVILEALLILKGGRVGVCLC